VKNRTDPPLAGVSPKGVERKRSGEEELEKVSVNREDQPELEVT